MVNRQKNYSRSTNLKVYGLGVLLSVLLILSVFFAIDAATSGAEVAKLQNTQAVLTQANSMLTDSLVQASSLESIDGKASQLGFSQPDKVIYISQEEAVAEAR